MAEYPSSASITWIEPGEKLGTPGQEHSAIVEQLQDEVGAMALEIGANPSDTSSDLKTRVGLIETRNAERHTHFWFTPTSPGNIATGGMTEWLAGPGGTVTVPSWATKAIVQVNLTTVYSNDVTCVAEMQLLVGADTPNHNVRLQCGTADRRYNFGWCSEVDLTSTGSKAVVIRAVRFSGTGLFYSVASTNIDGSITWVA